MSQKLHINTPLSKTYAHSKFGTRIQKRIQKLLEIHQAEILREVNRMHLEQLNTVSNDLKDIVSERKKLDNHLTHTLHNIIHKQTSILDNEKSDCREEN